MIYELDKSHFYKVNHLTKSDMINIEIKVVVEGYNPGWIFVDDMVNPKTAMIWSNGINGFYFVGESSNEDFNSYLNDYIDNEIMERAKEQNMDSFEFSGTSRKWDAAFEEIFKNRNVSKSKQFVYRNRKKHISLKHMKLKDNFVIKEITKEMFEEDMYNLEFVKSAIHEWWESRHDFFENGIGYCILHNKIAVCYCVASFFADGIIESHIKTKMSYRNQGLASIAVSAFVKQSLERKMELYWDCMENNHGSRALAKKSGYEKDYEYFLYEFNFNEFQT